MIVQMIVQTPKDESLFVSLVFALVNVIRLRLMFAKIDVWRP